MNHPETRKALNKFKDEVVENAQRELGTTRVIRGRKVRRVNSDALRKSLFGKVKFRNQGFQIDFSSKMDYANFVHEGVNGTRLKVGSRYSFKSKFINIDAAKEIVKGRKFRIRKNGKFVTKQGEEGKKNINGAAYVIAKSIAEKGIVGVPYYTLGIETALKKGFENIENAITIDALNVLDL